MDQSSSPVELAGELARLVGEDAVLTAGMGAYATDSTEGRGLRGWPDAVVMPADAGAVAQVVAWCYHHGVPMVPRGGGTGFAGGAVPVDGGVVISLERLRRVRAFDPLLWRANVEAGLTTAEVQRLARESGLDFPPNPGAAEQSQIGGNIATNAGGPRSFKYGATGELGDRAGGCRGARRADLRRRSDASGRCGVRPEAPPGRLGGDAGDRHGRVAAAASRAGRPAPGGRAPP